MMISSNENAAVNPGTLSVPPDATNEEDDEYDEHSGDNDCDEEEKLQSQASSSNVTFAGRSGVARMPEVPIEASPNPTSVYSSRSEDLAMVSRPTHNTRLLNPVYFVVFPTVYFFNRQRIVCRVDHNDEYHEVDLRPSPNPPGPESVFHIGGIAYWFDHTNLLWYYLAGQWYMKATYLDLTGARQEVAGYAEQNRLAAPPIIGAPSNTTNTISANSQDQDSTSDDDYLYRPLSPHPDRGEIDRWIMVTLLAKVSPPPETDASNVTGLRVILGNQRFQSVGISMLGSCRTPSTLYLWDPVLEVTLMLRLTSGLILVYELALEVQKILERE
ncbi:hypothetical protein FRC09_004595 [Ceratobasidium sp. 395]|nr:hypothetical protein FRC09_004595 [Ceratobasidium sp. 395]